MPELPEVEVTRTRIATEWIGRRIARVATSAPSYFFLTPPDVLARRLRGRTPQSIFRHGKYLVSELDDRSRLLWHLGMTGQLFTCDVGRARRLVAGDPHVHLTLRLEAERSPARMLLFRDVRKFGKVEWLPPGEEFPRLLKMGPDALVIDARALHRALAPRAVPIKTALLDQSVLAGVGNIYADEALFLARLHPRRSARSLDLVECRALVRALRQVLSAAIRAGGSTINDFLQADGEPGAYQQRHRVYGKSGEPCPRCGHEVARIVLAGRSTHFCPRCQ